METITLESTDIEIKLRSGESLVVDLISVELMIEKVEEEFKDHEGTLSEKGTLITEEFRKRFSAESTIPDFSFSEAWLLLQHIRSEYIQLKKTLDKQLKFALFTESTPTPYPPHSSTCSTPKSQTSKPKGNSKNVEAKAS